MLSIVGRLEGGFNGFGKVLSYIPVGKMHNWYLNLEGGSLDRRNRRDRSRYPNDNKLDIDVITGTDALSVHDLASISSSMNTYDTNARAMCISDPPNICHNAWHAERSRLRDDI